MFDFVEGPLSPGESWPDNHHYGVRVYNPTATWGQLTLRLGPAEITLRLAPEQILNVNDEESQAITVTNAGDCDLRVEWKKTRD